MYVKHVELVCGADPFLPPYILHCLCAIVQSSQQQSGFYQAPSGQGHPMGYFLVLNGQGF